MTSTEPTTVALTLPGTDDKHDDAACVIWLDAVLATPPYRRADGTEAPSSIPLWADLLSLALRRGWPRDSAVESRRRFIDILRHASELARMAGAPSAPTLEPESSVSPRVYEHRTACDTVVRIEFPQDESGSFLPAVITVTGRPASVYRRAAAAARGLECFEREWRRQDPAPIEVEEEVEVVTRDTGDSW